MDVQSGGRHILINGLVMILAGLVWGPIIAGTPYPRLAIGAHIQFELHGLLFILMAVLLLKLEHTVGAKSMLIMVVSVWLTWLMLVSELANSWWGTTQLLAIAGRQAGATGGAFWQESLMKVTHIGAAIVLIVGWAALTLGFVKRGTARS